MIEPSLLAFVVVTVREGIILKKTLSIIMVIGLLLGGIPAPVLALPSESGSVNIAAKDTIVNKPSLPVSNEKNKQDDKTINKEQPIVHVSSPLPPLPGEVLVEPKSTGDITIDSKQKSAGLDDQVEIPILVSEVENLDALFYGGAPNYKEVKDNVLKATKERQTIAKNGGRQWDKESWGETGDSVNNDCTEEMLEQAKQDRLKYEGTSDHIANDKKDESQNESGNSSGKESASTGTTETNQESTSESEPTQTQDSINKKTGTQETNDNVKKDGQSVKSTEEPQTSSSSSDNNLQQKPNDISNNN